MKYFTILLLFLALFFSACNFNRTPEKEKQSVTTDITIAPRTGINDSLAKIGYTIDTIRLVSLKEFQGSFLYDKNCKMCHGNEGKGDGVVARHTNICPFDLTKLDKTDDRIYYVIINGKNNMPPKGDKLSDEDVWILIIYVKELKKD